MFQDKLRPRVWREVCAGHVQDVKKFKGDSYYLKLLTIHEGKESVATKQVLYVDRLQSRRHTIAQIELDLLRTFPTNKHFKNFSSPVCWPRLLKIHLQTT